MSTITTQKLKEMVRTTEPKIIEIRRNLHQNPELGFEEVYTSKLVMEELKRIGLQTQCNLGKTGVSAIIEGKGAGKTIALRADMDALPIHEDNNFDYASKTPGKMHACGHDGHTAMLIGVAMVLSQLREHFNGCVKLIFQPSEENVSGAEAMIRDGVMDNPKPSGVLALHGWPGIPLGKIGLRGGPVMASADTFDITITGKGGHAAYPQGATDPIYISSLIIQALQGLISRESGLEEPAVISVTRVVSGSTYNVIPETAVISGTFRTLSEDKRNNLGKRIQSVASSIAEGFKAKCDFHLEKGTPVTYNHPDMVRLVEKAVIELYSIEAISPMASASMGAEDFAFYGMHAPSCMFFLGLGDVPFCHNPKFDFNDKALPIGIEMFCRAALDYLNA